MKNRLDTELFLRGMTESREKAKAMVMSGIVYVNGQKADKPGKQIASDAQLEIRGKTCPYVSRGGLKLEKALTVFGVDPYGKIGMDIGVSSGGFTDCLLQSNAEKVYGIDVGYGQIAYALRIDPRVILFEKTNFRYFETQNVADKIDLAVMDVSFISILKLADRLLEFLSRDAEMIFLIKPQFESEREMVGKHGVITDTESHKKILCSVIDGLIAKGIFMKNLDYSPIKGAKGNIEFLGHFVLSPQLSQKTISDLINQCVKRAHEELG